MAPPTMLKMFIVFTCFVLAGISYAAGQQYALFETATLAEASVNPETEVFYGSCKNVAFNCALPTLNAGVIAYGPARTFIYDENLEDKVGQGILPVSSKEMNLVSGQVRINLLSVKFLLEAKHRTELLLDFQLRGIASIRFKTGLLGLSVAAKEVGQGINVPLQGQGILNTDSYYTLFSQVSMGLRKNITDDVSVGVIASYLSGVTSSSLYIPSSDIAFSSAQQADGRHAEVQATGYLASSTYQGNDDVKAQVSPVRRFIPSRRNPGASLSASVRMRVDDWSAVSFSLKDAGFILWRASRVFSLASSTDVALKTFRLKSEVDTKFKRYFLSDSISNYRQYLPLKAEGVYTRILFPFYKAVGILSKPLLEKEVFFSVINDFQYRNLHALVNFGYYSGRAFDAGINLLLKSNSIELFIGSERLLGTTRVHEQLAFREAGYPLSADFNFGFAAKFGSCHFIQNARNMHLNGGRSKRIY